MQKEPLTTEALKKHFKNNFELANYAIGIARSFIKAGHEVDIEALLRDITRNPNQYRLEELEAMEKADEQPQEFDQPNQV